MSGVNKATPMMLLAVLLLSIIVNKHSTDGFAVRIQGMRRCAMVQRSFLVRPTETIGAKCCCCRLNASQQDDEQEETTVDDKLATETIDDLQPKKNHLVAGMAAAVVFVSFWPLLALLRINAGSHHPLDGFDVDMFMALQQILDGGNNNASFDNMDNNPSSILELPSLSPAEQLVGAIFGPPR